MSRVGLITTGRDSEPTDPIDFPRLLRVSSERRGEEAEGKDYDEYRGSRNPQSAIGNPQSSHSITSSARMRSDWGIFSPRVLAVLRLMIRSNLVGCSTGRSPGLKPLRILST